MRSFPPWLPDSLVLQATGGSPKARFKLSLFPPLLSRGYCPYFQIDQQLGNSWGIPGYPQNHPVVMDDHWNNDADGIPHGIHSLLTSGPLGTLAACGAQAHNNTISRSPEVPKFLISKAEINKHQWDQSDMTMKKFDNFKQTVFFPPETSGREKHDRDRCVGAATPNALNQTAAKSTAKQSAWCPVHR